ncbi:MAG TPA: hypothetical protein VK550_32835 [Polyangiaceae bacterium]|jgi:hypothetical protein|nr:hypothetical protein [Polyangiaceae bacterium]
MIRLRTLFIWTLIGGAGALYAGCAGQLTDAEKEFLVAGVDGGNAGGAGGAGVGTGGATGVTGGTGGVGTGGATGGAGGTTVGGTGGATGGTAGAGGGPLDPCMAPLAKDKCSTVGCHGGALLAAGLDLSAAMIAAPQPLVDKLNRGETGGCTAAVGKIIDSQKPDQSLLYTKITTQSCGAKMPPGTPLAPAETGCVLNWIRSIVGGGSGGGGGAAGAGGSGGTVDAGRG